MATMTRDEIYSKVQAVLVDALGVDEEEVTPEAVIRDDLGAESIDFLDIIFRLEKAFGIKIPRGEMMPENLANDPTFVRRFEAETRLIADLDFPQVVPIYDFWREPDGAIVVEKLMTGGSLRSMLALGQASPSRVCEIVGRLSLPLARAHEIGIVHGGITLDNVLLDSDGSPLITDFGMSSERSAIPADDIAGLVTCAAQLLAGSDESLPRLTERLEPGLAAIVADPGAYDTVDQFADAFCSVVGEQQVQVSVEDVPNPYMGLEPFDEADTALAEHRGVLLVVGPPRVAAVDDHIALAEQVAELADGLPRRVAGRHHHPHHLGGGECLDQLLETADVGDVRVAVVADHGVPGVAEPGAHVSAHLPETDQP